MWFPIHPPPLQPLQPLTNREEYALPLGYSRHSTTMLKATIFSNNRFVDLSKTGRTGFSSVDRAQNQLEVLPRLVSLPCKMLIGVCIRHSREDPGAWTRREGSLIQQSTDRRPDRTINIPLNPDCFHIYLYVQDDRYHNPLPVMFCSLWRQRQRAVEKLQRTGSIYLIDLTCKMGKPANAILDRWKWSCLLRTLFESETISY